MSEPAPTPTPAPGASGGDELGATPLVRRLAAQHGVDLATVAGTGVAGRIRPADVLVAAGVPKTPPPPSLARQTAAATRFPANPLAAELQARNRELANRAAQSGVPEPTLFSTGDLPAFCASGVDPQVLLQVPWQARPALAASPTQARAYELVEAYSGPDAENRAAWDFRDVEEGYRSRYGNWLADAMTMDEVYDAVMTPIPLGGAEPRTWPAPLRRLGSGAPLTPGRPCAARQPPR